MLSKICVIVPIYNAEKTLYQCLSSIFNQTFEDFIVIAVNDGSTDKTAQILSNFAKDKRLKILTKKNGGVSSARNYALDSEFVKECEFLTFVDADDLIVKDFFSTIFSKGSNFDAIYSLCNKFFKYEDINVVESGVNDLSFEINDKQQIMEKSISFEISGSVLGKIWKTTIWNDLRFEESISWCEDNIATRIASSKCNNVLVTNYCGYYFNRDQNLQSLTRSKMTNSKILDSFRSDQILYNYFDSYIENLDNKVFDKLLHLIADDFLSLYPRFDYKNCTKEEKINLHEHIFFIKSKRIIKFFKPLGIKNKGKKLFIALSFKLYRFVARSCFGIK